MLSKSHKELTRELATWKQKVRDLRKRYESRVENEAELRKKMTTLQGAASSTVPRSEMTGWKEKAFEWKRLYEDSEKKSTLRQQQAGLDSWEARHNALLKDYRNAETQILQLKSQKRKEEFKKRRSNVTTSSDLTVLQMKFNNAQEEIKRLERLEKDAQHWQRKYNEAIDDMAQLRQKNYSLQMKLPSQQGPPGGGAQLSTRGSRTRHAQLPSFDREIDGSDFRIETLSRSLKR